MSLNIGKTKVIHFRKRNKNKMSSEYCFLFNNGEVKYTEQYKYLGLLLTEHLEWEKEIYRKANRALALLNQRARSCGGLHLIRTVCYLIN